MKPVVAAVCSADALALAGAGSLLADHPAVTVVSRDELSSANVALVVTDEVDAQALDLVHWIARSSAVPMVLVADRAPDCDPIALARCRVASVLPRRDVTAELLSAAIEEVTCPARASAVPAAELASRLRELSPPHDHGLTVRELDLLRLLADGYDTAEVASAMAYSERMVKKVVHGLLSRLQLRNRAHAVAFALRTGVL